MSTHLPIFLVVSLMHANTEIRLFWFVFHDIFATSIHSDTEDMLVLCKTCNNCQYQIRKPLFIAGSKVYDKFQALMLQDLGNFQSVYFSYLFFTSEYKARQKLMGI